MSGTSWTRPSLLAGSTLLVLTSLAAGQATGTVTGRVIDAATDQPLAGVQIVVEGINLGGLTDEDGRYQLQRVPAGDQTVVAIILGYERVFQSVTVPAGGSVVLDFRLGQSAIALDEIVVTATGRQRKRELGHVVSTLAAPEVVESAPITTLSNLLQGRTAGVQVLQSSGTTGMGSRIRIRGSNSISLSNEPLVYVDGIRVDNSVSSVSIYTGGQSPSRLDDLNPEDIESIEIVKGPAAATLYGTDAANGVIWIATKRGQTGPARWNVWLEQGLLTDPTEYPLNYAGVDSDAATSSLRKFCTLDSQLKGLCEQEEVASYQVLNDRARTPIGTGNRAQYGVSVTGGSEVVSYYLSAELENEVGTLELPRPDARKLDTLGIRIEDQIRHPNQLERVNVRANLQAQLRENASVGIQAGYVSSNHHFANNDNSALGVLPSGYFGRPFPDQRAGWGYLPPYQSFGVQGKQDVERFTGSLNGTWTPLDFLQVRGTGGIDLSSRHDDFFIPRGLAVFYPTGFRRSNFRTAYRYTLDLGASAALQLTPAIGSRTSVGAQYYRDLLTGTDATGRDLLAGTRSIAGAAITEADETTIENKTLGVFIEEQLDWENRFFLSGALRGDDNSAFGQDFDFIVYPKVSASWLLSEETFFPQNDFVSRLRLRTAWGASGVQPGSTDAVRTLSPVAVTDPGGQDIIGVTFDNIGNSKLKAERSRELEVGLDADLFGGRVGLEATHYRKKTRDALVHRPIAPSLGASPGRWENLGSVENHGWEIGITADLLTTENLAWSVSLQGSTNDNKLLKLGEGVEPFGGLVRQVAGFPLGGLWAEPLESWNDTNGDGIIAPEEVIVGDTAAFVGAGLPQKEASFTTSLTLFRLFRVYALFDWRGDFWNNNHTEYFRCKEFKLCRGLNDPDAPLWEQARAMAAAYHPTNTEFGYLEDASFIKLREVSITLTAPESWARYLRAERATLTLTGRNLAVWTDYTGIDPELNRSAENRLATAEFLTQPPVRYWTARVNLTF